MRYAAYKSLEELWLTTIPSHWEARKIKYLFSERIEKGYPDEPLLVASQNMGVVPKGVYGNRTVEATKDLHLLKLVRIGDFVISLRSFQGGLEYAYYQGIISPAYTIIFPNERISTGYFKYLAKSRLFVELLQMCVTGIREGQNVDYTKLKNHQMPIPPRSEQDQIVRYLDWQVSKTNKLISALKKQIVLLKEQKQTVINEAVTKGLDPSIPMKDSSVEWIGEIPETWDLVPLCSIAKVISIANKGDEELLSVYLDDGVIPFSQKAQKRTNPTSKDLSKYQHVDYGNLVLNNQQAWRGSVGVSKLEGIVSPAYIILDLSKRLETDFANFLFRSKNMVYQYGLASKGVGSIQRNLYWPHLKRAFVLLPPLSSQEEIVHHILKSCDKIDDLIGNINSEIDLLVEYRTHLISDVVTGQVYVCDVEVPEFEYIADEANNAFDDESIDSLETMDEEV